MLKWKRVSVVIAYTACLIKLGYRMLRMFLVCIVYVVNDCGKAYRNDHASVDAYFRSGWI